MSGQVAITEFLSSGRQRGLPGFSDGTLYSRSSSGSGSSPDNGLWDTPSRLTFSFVPDGTLVSDYYESSLFNSFRRLLDTEELTRTLGDAFQTWARETSINFGQRTDSGEPLGIAGLSQGDPRFGDIRIAAIPLQEDVLAVALPFQLGMSGTWSGDILFNANASFSSPEQFYAVALHEIGHSLGLPHTQQSGDVMHPGEFNTTLSRNDLRALRTRYGAARMLDQYDADGDNNNNQESATRIRLAGSLKGSIPLIAYGDIASPEDLDYYELQIYSGYTGPVSFRVVSDGISQLAPEVSVLDVNGNHLGFTSSSSLNGDDLLITVTPNDDQLFLRIRGAAIAERRVGSYSVAALFDNDVSYDAAVLESTLRRDLWTLKQSDVHTIFSEPEPRFNDDLHTNDTPLTATDLDPQPGVLAENRFRVQAVISDAVDLDYYRVRASAEATTLTATLTSLEQLGLVGRLEFLDNQFSALNARVINHGNGRLIMEVDGIQPGDDYFIGVVADRPGEMFDTGNYNLDLSFRATATQLETFAEGHLTLVQPQSIHTLFVAETRLFNLGIESDFSAVYEDQAVWMTIYRDDGEIVHRAVTRPGEFRTANSVVLQPGTYSIRATLAFSPASSVPPSLRKSRMDYRILGTSIGDPIGPELITSGRQPFRKCDPATNEYCYPGDRHSSATFLVVTGNESTLSGSGTKSPDYKDANEWFWYQNWQGNQG
jgi:hypothetical protein